MSQQEAGYAPPFWDIIRVGNVGTTVIVSLAKIVAGVVTPVDLTGNSLVEVHLRKPSGKVLEFIGAVFGPDVDGKIIVNDNVGIFDTRGRWACRGVAKFSSGNIFKGSWVGFPVDD